jgi:hypothetical protein
MPTLKMGIEDVAYLPLQKVTRPVSKGRHHKRRPNKKTAKAEVKTTGEVAEILEEYYGIMQAFYDLHENDIADIIDDSVTASLEAELEGNAEVDPYAAACPAIQALFRQFIDNKEMDGVIAGVPTKSAILGISHRFGSRVRITGRPSFQDTGLYEESFRAWFED